MGIPLYFKQISEKYPNIIKESLDTTKDNSLFLDLNCAIHPCCRKILEEYSDTKFNNNLVIANSIWQASNLIIATIIGVYLFNESITKCQYLGIIFAIIANVLLMY